VFLWLFFVPVQADAPISISSDVDKSTIRIGDLIRYTVTVTHDPDVRIQLPGEGVNLGGFDIRAYEAPGPRRERGRIVTESAYLISTFFTGEFEIPPTAVFYALPEDTAYRVLMTDPIHITVESVHPGEEGDIREIKPPEEIPRNWWLTLRWIGAGVLGGVLIVLGWIVYRRARAGKRLLPFRETPPRPPHEVAFDALERLSPSGLTDPVLIKAFYTDVSEIIRRYIEGRFFVPAPEMTTREVLDALMREQIEPDIREAVRILLEACDLVKFAKLIPPAPRHREVLDQACEIVHRTKIILGPSLPESGPVGENEEDGPAGLEVDAVTGAVHEGKDP